MQTWPRCRVNSNRNMWPMKRTSHPLPVEIGGGTKVYMTQHNGLKESDTLMGGPLTKHHYLFWE